MANYYVLYNPKAGNGLGKTSAHRLDDIYAGQTLTYVDVTTLEDVRGYLDSLPDDVTVILVGGDGTINHFVNALDGEDPGRDVFYYAAGTGNDFLHDLNKKEGEPPFLINPYLKDLPKVHVNGMTRYYLNGIGYGIDGYCCEVADKYRATKPNKPINYTGIAIRGLLFFYKRTTAEVTVDGVTESYKHVWLTPCMNGRFFGGGMMCAPSQDRLNAERHVTVMIMKCASKLRTLMVFPKIFEGKHVENKKIVTIKSGYKVHIRFDRPTALQIDGETVLNVLEYEVESAAVYKKQKRAESADIVG